MELLMEPWLLITANTDATFSINLFMSKIRMLKLDTCKKFKELGNTVMTQRWLD